MIVNGKSYYLTAVNIQNETACNQCAVYQKPEGSDFAGMCLAEDDMDCFKSAEGEYMSLCYKETPNV